MKAARALAFLFVALAVLMTGFGGVLDAWKGGYPPTFTLTKQHAWNDGIFLILLAIFLVIAF